MRSNELNLSYFFYIPSAWFNLSIINFRGLCEVWDQVQDKISNRMFKNEFKNDPRVFK
jgi:hypothetical protein